MDFVHALQLDIKLLKFRNVILKKKAKLSLIFKLIIIRNQGTLKSLVTILPGVSVIELYSYYKEIKEISIYFDTMKLL